MPINTGAILNSISGGLNTERIVSQLSQLRQEQELGPLQQEKEAVSNEISQISSVTKELGDLSSALDNLDQTSEVKALEATSSDDSIVTATATGEASESNYNITVNQLAQRDKHQSQGFASKTGDVESGQLDIAVDAGSTDEKNLTINVTDADTLSDVRDKINNQFGGEVNASIIDDGNDFHLKVERETTGHATDTGASDALTISQNTTGPPTGGQDLNFSEIQAGQNASFDLDGTNITRQSNTVDGVASGVTFNLESTGTTQVEVSQNVEGTKENIQGFVDSYNSVIEELNADSDVSSGVKRRAKSALQDVVANKVPGTNGEFQNLSSIGIESDFETGKLSIDDSKLSNAIQQDSAAVSELFAKDNDGISDALSDVAERYENEVFANTSNSLNSQLDSINDEISETNEDLTEYRKELEDRFAQLKVLRRQTQNQFQSLL
jgi:flagellar hook-associated protein 2